MSYIYESRYIDMKLLLLGHNNMAMINNIYKIRATYDSIKDQWEVYEQNHKLELPAEVKKAFADFCCYYSDCMIYTTIEEVGDRIVYKVLQMKVSSPGDTSWHKVDVIENYYETQYQVNHIIVLA